MEGILLFAALGIFALIVLKLLAAKSSAQPESSDSLGYRKKKTLFTAAERSFLGVLDQVIDPEEYRIFGKVRVADLIEPNPSQNRSLWQRAFNAISAKHFDYVICTTDTLIPICVIELDDKSHNQKKRQQRDQQLENACKEAGLPLIRVPAKSGYKPEEVKAMLAERFDIKTASSAGNESDAIKIQAKGKN